MLETEKVARIRRLILDIGFSLSYDRKRKRWLLYDKNICFLFRDVSELETKINEAVYACKDNVSHSRFIQALCATGIYVGKL